ncbi:MAG: hypothetical protein ACRD29_10320 [Acidimicrobiales bacterium]
MTDRREVADVADPTTSFPPGTLRLAAWLIAVETVAQVLLVMRRSEVAPALRGVLMVTLGLKFGLLWAAFRRSAGAMLLLLLFEFTAVFVALVPSGLPLWARFALGFCALAALVLLGASVRAFPPPALPQHIPRPEPDDE